MLSFKCKNCNGEMAVSRIGDLKCPYCGSSNFFTDKELTEYKEFRRCMLEYLSASAEEEKAMQGLNQLWCSAETIEFITVDDMPINLEYIYKSTENDIQMYATRKNVIYIYPSAKKMLAQKAIDSFMSVATPQADMKSLEKCLPILSGRYDLKDGSVMLVFAKEENVHPVSMFGDLPAKHVEWIISRLENIACLLEFNNIVHGGITPDAVFINPITHEAALFGNWHDVKTHIRGNVRDLYDIRQTASALLGKDYGDAPEPLIHFLQKQPALNAFEDFAAWDNVIEKELGGRHFTKFSL